MAHIDNTDTVAVMKIDPEVRHEEVSRGEKRWMTMEVTAYTDAEGGSLTTSGDPTEDGVAAAGDSFPFGTILYIEGYGEVTVKDRGGAVTDGHLDVWFSNITEAKKFGRKNMRVHVVKWGGS